MNDNPFQQIYNVLNDIKAELRILNSTKKEETSPGTDELMDVEAASRYLKISRHTIFAKTASNSIPFIRLGKRSIRFRKSDLLAWAQLNNLKSK